MKIKWLYGNDDNDAYNDSDSDDDGDGDDDGDNDAAMMVTMMMDTLFGSANAQLYIQSVMLTPSKTAWADTAVSPRVAGQSKFSVSPSSWADTAAARMALPASFLHPAVKQGNPYRRQAPRLPQSP